MENKTKHLEMLQSVISRMSNNSFLLKGWAITLLAGFYALSSNNTDKAYYLVSYLPTIAFWLLDSYYLYLEKQYRRLYDKVRVLPEDKIDFSMNAVSTDHRVSRKEYLECVLSKTELWFYFPLAVVCLIILFITHI